MCKLLSGAVKGMRIMGGGGGVNSSLGRSIPHCLDNKVSSMPKGKLFESRFGPVMISEINFERLTGIKGCNI